ncbi:MAG: AAA family ATPase, partial [Ghiorsea sp.]
MDTFTAFQTLQKQIERKIIGQAHLANRLLIAILADGHLLVEGAPGLAKTRAIKVLSDCIEGEFHRVQFTPDLLPSDLTGIEIYRPQDGTFHFQKGPLFHNLLLADEINRAPAKVQSALLEAMAERQITVGSVSYPLPDLFLVMATQHPIEQEGTYPLPEAQLDRFLLHVTIDYPAADAERDILRLSRQEASHSSNEAAPQSLLTQSVLQQARQEVLDLHVADALEEYMIQL